MAPTYPRNILTEIQPVEYTNNELNHYYLYLIDIYQKTNDIKYIDEINIKDINYHKEIYNKFKELFQ